MKYKTKRKTIAFMGCIIMMILAGLAAGQLYARRQFFARGQVLGFPEAVADTEVRPLCINVELTQYDAAGLTWALDTIADGGFTWVRQRFAWADIEVAPGDFRWATWDALIAETVAHNVRFIAVLDTVPDWAIASEGTGEPDPVAFARFASAVAARYGDTLTYYQIWHNPNLGDSWAGPGGHADAYGYAELLASAAQAIRAADNEARIILGSLAPNGELGTRNYAEDVFLDRLYVAGAQPHFDVVAIQPYGFFTGPEDRTVARETLNFSRAILVREALVMHGDAHKAIWISHFGWNSKPAAWPGPASIWGHVAAATQAAYTVAALTRAEREWPWMGMLCLNGFQPRPETVAQSVPNAEEHWGFAIVGPEGEPRPLYAAVQAWAARPTVARTGVHNASTPLADFEGAWTLGPLGADIGERQLESDAASRVRLTFAGTGIALTVRRGPYRAFLYVTVDGKPAPALPRDREGRSYMVLYDPLTAVATVPLAENLPYGTHTVVVEAERGWNQWALADWRITSTPETTYIKWQMVGLGLLAGFGLGLGMILGRGLDWGRWGDWAGAVWDRLRAGGQIVLAMLLSALYLFSAWQVMMSEQLFRRLGEGGKWTAVALALGLYYFSPWLVLSLVAGSVVICLVLLRPSLGLALTMLAVPLYMHPLSLLGKSFALAELILLPTLVGWAIHRMGTVNPRIREWRMANGESRVKRSTTGNQFHVLRQGHNVFRWPLLAFVCLAMLSSVFAQQRHEAWRELRLVVVEPVLFYMVLVTLPMSRRERWRVVDAFVAGALVVALVGLLQYGASFCRGMPMCDALAHTLGETITAEGGMRRLHSVYGSPNNVGLYLGRVLPVVLAVILWGGTNSPHRTLGREGRRGWGDAARAFMMTLLQSPRRLFYTLALPSIGLALLLSLSRGAIILGVPAALLALGVLAGPKWRRATAVVLLLGILALIPLLRTPRFAGMLDFSSGTTGFRLSLWHSAWGMVREHPWLGVGLDNFLYAYRTRYVLPTAWEEFNLAHPHNVVLDFASRLGVLGLGVFLWIQFQFWRTALPLRQRRVPLSRALALGAMGLMANFWGHGLVDASYFVIDLAYAFCLALAVVVWLNREEG